MSMSNTLFVGIDVSSSSNSACLMSHDGSVIAKASFSNDLSGANSFVDSLIHYLSSNSFKKLVIATESSAFFDFHLIDFLATNLALAPYNPQIYQFNPKIVKAFKRGCYSDISKTDRSDAFAIADRLRFGRLPTPYQEHQPYLPLRRLTRYRFHIIQTLTREKSYFLTHLYLKFSKFSNGCPFSHEFGTTSLSCITEFGSVDDIANSSVDNLAQFIQKHGKNRFAEPHELAKCLQHIARESYRLRPALINSVNFILCSTLCTIRHLQKSLKELNSAISLETRAFPNTLESVPGIGPVYSAGIISEIGNIRNFSSEAALAKFAGLTWRQHQSGEFESEETPMSKTGNQYLRYYLIEAANALRMHNAQYREYYNTKFKEVTKHQHKRALALAARKFVRLCYALLKKGQLYKSAD
jgi:transposase